MLSLGGPENDVDWAGGEYVVIVDENNISLGFSAKGTPPDPVLVANVDPDGWAASQGIGVGDTLISVGDKKTADMTKRELVKQMKDGERPLQLVFLRHEESSSSEGETETSSQAPTPVARKKRLSEEKMSPARQEHKSIIVRTGANIYHVEAAESIKSLGLAPVGVPPGAVTVARLEPHGWASGQHVAIGDEMQLVGTREVSTMTKDELVESLKGRPIRLTLKRSASAIAVQVSDAKAALKSVASAARELREELDTEEAEDTPMTQTRSVKAVALLTCLSSMEQEEEEEEEQRAARGSDHYISAQVPSGVSELGFSLSSRWHSADAMKKMRVRVVDDDGWAARQGVAPGDFLVQVGNRSTLEMTKAELTVKLKLGSRPMELKFKKNKKARSQSNAAKMAKRESDATPTPRRRSIMELAGQLAAKAVQAGSPYTVVAMEGSQRLGFAPTGDPPGRVTVGRLEPNSWAASQGVLLGDELLRVGDRIISAMTRTQLVEDLQAGTRPLRLTFQRPVANTNGVEAMLTRISAARVKLSEAARSAAMAKSDLQEQLNRRSFDAGSSKGPSDDKAMVALAALAATSTGGASADPTGTNAHHIQEGSRLMI